MPFFIEEEPNEKMAAMAAMLESVRQDVLDAVREGVQDAFANAKIADAITEGIENVFAQVDFNYRISHTIYDAIKDGIVEAAKARVHKGE